MTTYNMRDDRPEMAAIEDVSDFIMNQREDDYVSYLIYLLQSENGHVTLVSEKAYRTLRDHRNDDGRLLSTLKELILMESSD